MTTFRPEQFDDKSRCDDSWPGPSDGEPADDGFDDLRDMLGVASISDRLRAHLDKVVARLSDDSDTARGRRG